jgi:hypothetical protein
MRNYLLAVLAIGIGFILAVLFYGGLIVGFLDLPSAITVVVFPFIYQWALFGSSGVRKAFAAGFKKTAPMEDIKTAQLFFRSYAKITWFSVLLSCVIGTITMLIYLEDPSGLGPNIAVMLISLLYAILLEFVAIVPFLVILKRRIIELNIEI